MKEGIRVWRRDQGTADLALYFLKFLMFREGCNVARKKKDIKRAEGNSNKDEIKRSCKERLHAISFNLLPTPSASFFFTSAFIPSSSSPVGPRVLLRSKTLTWFIVAACDFYKQRQGADKEETFFCCCCSRCKACWRTHLSILLLLLQSPDIMSFRTDENAFQFIQTGSTTKVAPRFSCLCCSIESTRTVLCL